MLSAVRRLVHDKVGKNEPVSRIAEQGLIEAIRYGRIGRVRHRQPGQAIVCGVADAVFAEHVAALGRQAPLLDRFEEPRALPSTGLRDRWRGDGPVIASCTIIVTGAKRLQQAIHDRTQR